MTQPAEDLKPVVSARPTKPVVHDTSAVPTGSAITYPRGPKRKFQLVKQSTPGEVPAQAAPNKTKPKNGKKPWWVV